MRSLQKTSLEKSFFFFLFFYNASIKFTGVSNVLLQTVSLKTTKQIAC